MGGETKYRGSWSNETCIVFLTLEHRARTAGIDICSIPRGDRWNESAGGEADGGRRWQTVADGSSGSVKPWPGGVRAKRWERGLKASRLTPWSDSGGVPLQQQPGKLEGRRSGGAGPTAADQGREKASSLTVLVDHLEAGRWARGAETRGWDALLTTYISSHQQWPKPTRFPETSGILNGATKNEEEEGPTDSATGAVMFLSAGALQRRSTARDVWCTGARREGRTESLQG